MCDARRVWRVKVSRATNRMFYMHAETGEKRWNVDPALIHDDHADAVWRARKHKKSGKTFYQNVVTGKRTWKRPPASLVVAPGTARSPSSSKNQPGAAGAAAADRRRQAASGSGGGAEHRVWKRKVNPRNGRVYYKNVETGKGTYAKPDDALIVRKKGTTAPLVASDVAPHGSVKSVAAGLPAPPSDAVRARRNGRKGKVHARGSGGDATGESTSSATFHNPLAARKKLGFSDAAAASAYGGTSKQRGSVLGGTVLAAASAQQWRSRVEWRARLHKPSGRIFYKNTKSGAKVGSAKLDLYCMYVLTLVSRFPRSSFSSFVFLRQAWTPPEGAKVANSAEARMRREILKLRKKNKIASAATEESR